MRGSEKKARMLQGATRGRSKYEDIQEICGGEGWERGDQEGRKAIGTKERSF
jgi:hypothetical protein